MDNQPEHERYVELAKWFLSSPARAELFIRAHGTLEDLEVHLIAVKALLRREERRQWLTQQTILFLKAVVAVAAGLAVITAAVPIVRSLLAGLLTP